MGFRAEMQKRTLLPQYVPYLEKKDGTYGQTGKRTPYHCFTLSYSTHGRPYAYVIFTVHVRSSSNFEQEQAKEPVPGLSSHFVHAPSQLTVGTDDRDLLNGSEHSVGCDVVVQS